MAKWKFIVILFISCNNPSRDSNIDNKKHESIKLNLDLTKSQVDTSVCYYENETINHWLKLKLEQQCVIKKLGLPENIGIDEYWSGNGLNIQSWEYTSLGVILEMASITCDESKFVHSIRISKPCDLSTSKGIKIGTSMEVIKKKYSEQINNLFSTNEIIIVGSLYGGIFFKIEKGYVNEIFIGSIAE
jgi:hypothetical protein